MSIWTLVSSKPTNPAMKLTFSSIKMSLLWDRVSIWRKMFVYWAGLVLLAEINAQIAAYLQIYEQTRVYIIKSFHNCVRGKIRFNREKTKEGESLTIWKKTQSSTPDSPLSDPIRLIFPPFPSLSSSSSSISPHHPHHTYIHQMLPSHFHHQQHYPHTNSLSAPPNFPYFLSLPPHRHRHRHLHRRRIYV